MKKLVDPVMAAYAKEIGADEISRKINAIVTTRANAGAARAPPACLRTRIEVRACAMIDAYRRLLTWLLVATWRS